MADTPTVTPFALKDAPALIERLLPVQRLSVDVYRERMAGSGQTLTFLGSYWKGRKPLILNKACVLGCLLPATDQPEKDLEIFELLMGMDEGSLAARWKHRITPRQVLAKVTLARVTDYFDVKPQGALPMSAPIRDIDSNPQYKGVRVTWREDVPLAQRRALEALCLPEGSYRDLAGNKDCRRPEETPGVHDHVWDRVNQHLGTSARSFPELVEQLGVMRFGHRPRVADPFCGSGQIPFEAARLGCDAIAADLNPVACLLTWGAFHIAGARPGERDAVARAQRELVEKVQAEIDDLGVETDGRGGRPRAFLYCLEVRCPQTGWMVPLLPSRVISTSRRVIAELVPIPEAKRYRIALREGVDAATLEAAKVGTVRSEGRGGKTYVEHTVDGRLYRISMAALRGDAPGPDGRTRNRLRPWEKTDFRPRPDDLFQERLYAICWVRPRPSGDGARGTDAEHPGEEADRAATEFREVTPADLAREKIVEEYLARHLEAWQREGWIPDMPIEPGKETERLTHSRGWTHWHHLFTPRQLLVAGLVRKHAAPYNMNFLFALLNRNSNLSRWDPTTNAVIISFYNQALNPLYNHGCQSFWYAGRLFDPPASYEEVRGNVQVMPMAARDFREPADLFITDPPYGDAVSYEEILDFFIAWARRHPPAPFDQWTWDSRRPLAIRGDDATFRHGMIDAYENLARLMPDNGLQVIMFTHQSASLWADMARVVWASGLRVTAAWYVVTETDSALREGAYVKGTVLLVCRKRAGNERTTRDDLEWEIQEAVQRKVEELTGLNERVRGNRGRSENLFEDADLQMAGYAAALETLTRYAYINGRDMIQEARDAQNTRAMAFVDELIAFAVELANRHLIPQGLARTVWEKLSPSERFYLKMVELESRGLRTLDNYQNFAKAFRVANFRDLMAVDKANNARLKGAVELGRGYMERTALLGETVTRAVLYAMMELVRQVDGDAVLAHLRENLPGFVGDLQVRERAVAIAKYLEVRLRQVRPEESRAARVLVELIDNERLR